MPGLVHGRPGASTTGEERENFENKPALMRLSPALTGVTATDRPSIRARASPNGFPKDYPAVVRDSQEATKRAMLDGLRLLEVEFPVASLMAVQGDEEGANEMTKSSEYLRQYARAFLEVASSTRVFFPDVKESELQASGVWADFPSINLDYLTKPSGLLDIGIDLSGTLEMLVEPRNAGPLSNAHRRHTSIRYNRLLSDV